MSQGHRECQHSGRWDIRITQEDFRRKRVSVVVIKLLKERVANLIKIGYRM